MKKTRLGVNIDHVATLRQARGVSYPSPIQGAMAAIAGGADGITLHLREDRRHIQDQDLFDLKAVCTVPINLEIAVTQEMLAIASEIKPHSVCFVPEKREELTTEGGLDVVTHFSNVHKAVEVMQKQGILVSLFIDPNHDQIDAAGKTGTDMIEIHTGQYANADTGQASASFLTEIQSAATYADQQGLIVNAGHGLHYGNTNPIAQIPVMHELNIGHSIIAESVFIGLEAAVRKMKDRMQ